MNPEIKESMPDPDRMDTALLRILSRVEGSRNLTEEEQEKLLKRSKFPIRNSKNLTDRDKEILIYISHGLNNKGVAEVLGISRETVQTHLKLAKRAFACKTRAQLVAEAIRRGVIN